MQRFVTLLLVSAGIGSAVADTISTQAEYHIDGFTGGTITFDRFDDMNGSRQLTGVSFSYDQTIEFDLTIESNGYTPLSAGDWTMEAGVYSIHQLGVIEQEGDGGPNYPLFGAGGVYAPPGFSVDLGASDGYNQSGPDTHQQTFGEHFTFSQSFNTGSDFGQRVLEAVTGEGELDTFMGQISDLYFEWVNDPNWIVDPKNPPDGPFFPGQDPYYGIFVSFDRIVQSGTLTVTYEYTSVPAPSALLSLSGMGLIAMRRKR